MGRGLGRGLKVRQVMAIKIYFRFLKDSVPLFHTT